MAVGDKTPGASTTNMPNIASTTLLLQHDGKHADMKMGIWGGDAFFLICL